MIKMWNVTKLYLFVIFSSEATSQLSTCMIDPHIGYKMHLYLLTIKSWLLLWLLLLSLLMGFFKRFFF